MSYLERRKEMTLEGLRKKRADLLESAKKLLAGYTDGNMPDWALRAYDTATEGVRVLGLQIERMETAKCVEVEVHVLPFYKCPSCGIILSIGDKKEDIEYCWHCDQKLDWETEE
jgi:hypothetical protein